MEKGKYSKMTSCDPFNFEGDGVHLNLLNKPQFFEYSSFVTPITYYGKKIQLSKIYGMIKMVMKRKISKYSLATP